MTFDNVIWMNHPQATYRAEVKPYQLYVAKRIGFDVPETVVANAPGYYDRAANGKSKVMVKSLDPVILSLDGGRHSSTRTRSVPTSC